ncbi:MAG: DUF169 domain-containing protein [Dehalococcoidia bacterium]
MTDRPDGVGVAPDAPPEPDRYDWNAIVGGLNQYLRLRATPVGIKMFERVAEMEAIERVRRPQGRLMLDQIVAQARWNGWTMGVTGDDLGAQCAAPVGLYPQIAEWRERTSMSGVWFATDEDAIAHQQAMDCLPAGRYEALVVSPLTSGRLERPDVCLIYGTPAQMIILINGLQVRGYRKFEFSVVGESACADSWGRALRTGEPSLSIPCFAERRFGGVQDDELLMAIPPRYLPKAIEGLATLHRNGLRYPIAPIGIQADPTESLRRSYGG